MIEFQIEKGTKSIYKRRVWVLNSTTFHKSHLIGCFFAAKMLVLYYKECFLVERR